MKEKHLSHRRIRVLHVLPEGRTSGIQHYVLSLCSHLPRDRFYVEVCFLRTGPLLRLAELEGLHTAVAGWIRPNDVVAAARFGGYLQVGEFDILHAHQTRRRLRLVAQRCGVRHVVHHLHAVPTRDEIPYAFGGLKKWFHAATENCDCCLVGSEYLQKKIAELHPTGRKKIMLLKPGVDLNFWSKHPSKEEAKTALHLPTESFVIGTVARMVPSKRLDLFIELAAAVRAVMRQAIFVICGDGAMHAELEAQAAALGVSDNVRFLGWRRDLVNVMAAFDLFAMTTIEDTFAQSPLEPLAMGCPVVGFDSGSMSEWVEHRVSGLLAPVGDIKALRDAVVSIICQPSLYEKISRGAWERAHERFDITQTVKRAQELYESLLEGGLQKQATWSE